MVQLPSEQEFGDYGKWPGRDVLDATGDRLGGVREIYLDRETGRPEWVLVDVDGDEPRFVPLVDAAVESESIRVAHPRTLINAAPAIDPEARIDNDQERRLYAHYGIDYSQDESPTGLPVTEDEAPTGRPVTEDETPTAVEDAEEPPVAPSYLGGPDRPAADPSVAEPQSAATADLGSPEPPPDLDTPESPAAVEGGPQPPATTDLGTAEPPADLGAPERPAAVEGGPQPPAASDVGATEPPPPVAGGPRPVEAPPVAPPLASPPLGSGAPEPPPSVEGGPQPPRLEGHDDGGPLAAVRSKRSLALAGVAAAAAAALFVVVRRLRS